MNYSTARPLHPRLRFPNIVAGNVILVPVRHGAALVLVPVPVRVRAAAAQAVLQRGRLCASLAQMIC